MRIATAVLTRGSKLVLKIPVGPMKVKTRGYSHADLSKTYLSSTAGGHACGNCQVGMQIHHYLFKCTAIIKDVISLRCVRREQAAESHETFV